MIKRFYSNKLENWIQPNKVLVLYGPRQVGKTTLIRSYLENYKGKLFQSTGEDAQLQQLLDEPRISDLKVFFGDYDLLFIDEAQMIPNVGLALKLLVDHIPDIKIIATGSSSFDLSNKVGEPLVGRQFILKLLPVSLLELKEDLGWADVYAQLETLMIYGTYPDVLNQKSLKEKVNYLNLLRDGYLYKDLLILEQLKNSKKLNDLLRLLAFQIGQEVSIQELGVQLGMSKNTVARYLDLLEKAFVIINVRGFSRNLRKEVSKSSRFYFYDNGVRNAVINNFNRLQNRDDVGKLWENFVFMERMKKREYHQIHANVYFWRTYDQKEIDLVEERGGKLFGYEFKYRPQKVIPPQDWLKTYSGASFKVVHRDNLDSFIL